jgi:hypothetical protein
MTMTDEARQITPVEFFGGSRGIQYAKGIGFQEAMAVVEPTEAELAAIEAAAELENQEPPAVPPVDAAASSDPREPIEPNEPARPSPDDPEDKQPEPQASPGKGPGTPAKS